MVYPERVEESILIDRFRDTVMTRVKDVERMAQSVA